MKNIIAIALLALVTAASCGGGASSTATPNLAGAGATFPLPLYNMVFKSFADSTGSKVSYGGTGSGGGIRALKDRTVDFGATDAYLSDAELSEMGAPVLHIPTCMGAVVLGYKLQGVSGLRLTADVVADIYLGNITRWNDRRIVALNPGSKLPDMVITPVYRSDGSGTTYVFTDYLTKAHPVWAQKMGTGKALQWPLGIAAKGNPGVAGSIAQTEGAIGYIGSEYGLALDMPIALLKNASGNFVEANAQSISAAAKGALPEDMRCMVTNSAEPDAYPISCFTWIIVYQNQQYASRTEVQANTLKQLLQYMVSPAVQNITTKIHYAPLPADAVQKAQAIIATIQY